MPTSKRAAIEPCVCPPVPGPNLEDPRILARLKACYLPISKDLNSPRGHVEIRIQQQEIVRCAPAHGRDERPCQTLRIAAVLTSPVSSKVAGEPPAGAYPCDALGGALDGTFRTKCLTFVFDSDGSGQWTRRGVHAGCFLWRGRGITIEGRMSGIAGAGLVRASGSSSNAQAERCAEPCSSPLLHGHLRGVITGASGRYAHLKASPVTAVYRISYDPTPAGKPLKTTGSGVIEGLVITPCR
jgi:hypothetical protein